MKAMLWEKETPEEMAMRLEIPVDLERALEIPVALARIEGGVDQVAHPIPDQGLDFPADQAKDSD
ncbi:MAG: hypothetical protein HC921_22230 [Synechococcaceae cyanobacterium SM2_3_1]|nr:hypothetical protein [Synechococcaceae cyanobacterium SM2_3_1]